jgi:hypothetical protein
MPYLRQEGIRVLVVTTIRITGPCAGQWTSEDLSWCSRCAHFQAMMIHLDRSAGFIRAASGLRNQFGCSSQVGAGSGYPPGWVRRG